MCENLKNSHLSSYTAAKQRITAEVEVKGQFHTKKEFSENVEVFHRSLVFVLEERDFFKRQRTEYKLNPFGLYTVSTPDCCFKTKTVSGPGCEVTSAKS